MDDDDQARGEEDQEESAAQADAIANQVLETNESKVETNEDENERA